MKSSKLLISLVLAITLVAGIGLALGGCKTASTNLKEPASSCSQEQEKAIEQILSESKDAFNSKDIKAYLSYFTEDAQIMVGREQKIVSKAAYIKRLPGVFKLVGFIKHESFKIETDDNCQTAEVNLVASNSYRGGDFNWLIKKLRLVNRGGKWLIRESTYSVYFKGEDPREKRRGGDELEEN